MDLGQDRPPQAVTFYYDPLLDVHHRLPVMVAVINALYLAPQRPQEARRLFDAGLGMLGALGIFGVLGAVLPLGLTIALTALELLVAFLQAYVFTILTCIYLNDAIHPGH